MACLIVSFVGRADLRAFDLQEPRLPFVDDNIGPIKRLLSHLANNGLDPSEARLLLFDDRPDNGVRKQFRDALEAALPGLALGGLEIDRKEFALPGGPTDLKALYDGVWRAIEAGARDVADVLFNLSSGTPAMFGTLLLAARSLPIRPTLYESSPEKDVVRLDLPYEIATRERKGARASRLPVLAKEARKTLSRDTIVRDEVAAAAYASLYNIATRRRDEDAAPAVLIEGASGSGKWHAARQFAAWCGGEALECFAPPLPDPRLETAAVLLRRLDVWPAEALKSISAWRAQHPNVAMAATFRTDCAGGIELAAIKRDAVHGAATVCLPAPRSRSDIVELASVLAARAGLHRSKVKERLQQDLLASSYDLHQLDDVLRTAGSRSDTRHIERADYVQARDIEAIPQALALLRDGHAVLAGLDFGTGRPDLKTVLDAMQAAALHIAMAEGRTQSEAAELLGLGKQQDVSRLLMRGDLAYWRYLLAGDGNDGH